MAMTEQTNVKVNHGAQAFYTDAVALFHNEHKFICDFTQTTPRIDQVEGQQQQTVVVSHNTIVLDPVTAKKFLDVLEENIANYENKFGEISIDEQETVNEDVEESETVDQVKKGDYSYIG